MLIDTGASHTMIRDKILRGKAGLIPDGTAELVGYAGLLNTYTADLWVGDFGIWQPALEITQLRPDLEHPGFPHDGFFGRDLLAKCTFHVNGPDGTFTLFL